MQAMRYVICRDVIDVQRDHGEDVSGAEDVIKYWNRNSGTFSIVSIPKRRLGWAGIPKRPAR
jgi:hypothetical protein